MSAHTGCWPEEYSAQIYRGHHVQVTCLADAARHGYRLEST